MAAVLEVGIVDGIPVSGTGEVMTLDVIAAKLDTCITALQIIDNMVLAAGTNNIGDVDVLTVSGQTLAFNTGAATSATPRVVLADDSQLPAVANNADAVAAAADLFNMATVNYLYGWNGATYDRIQVDAAKSLKMTSQPSATGGLSVFRSLDLDETEEEVKATAGCLYKIRATNRTTSVRYLKLYNATAANTTVGTTTPIDTIPLPANASDYTVLTESFGGLGLTFDTALSMAVTTGFADNDTGAPGANDVIVSAYYK
jgi:hypothetical protein